MHAELNEWYRSAGIEPTDALPKRWSAIVAYNPDAPAVVKLARRFYGLGKASDLALDEFQAEIQKADPSFQTSDNENEFSLLSGAKLIEIIEASSDGIADLAALTLHSGAGANLRPAPRVRAIPERAARYVNDKTAHRALVNEADDVSSDPLLEGLSGGSEPLPLLATRLREMQRQLDLVREESNMLWWLFGNSSRDEKKHWSSIAFPSVPIIAAKELADLTTVIPGPIASRAFLERVIQTAKTKPPATISIADAINALSPEWRERYTNANCPAGIDTLMPITTGMKLSLTAPENNDWLPALTRGTLIPSNAKTSPSTLAYQTFLEAMLGKAWRSSSE
jgi:hypothetical protein